MATAVAGMNSTERTLVIVRHAVGVLVQVAYRDAKDAARDAARARDLPGVTEVTVDTVPNYRGRRVTRVIL